LQESVDKIHILQESYEKLHYLSESSYAKIQDEFMGSVCHTTIVKKPLRFAF
jgi:hypothetical protein